jgi:diguanylate cyclase (GGDEF)-like protein/putative nucleotidyltransferase with HDIG domain
MSEDKEVVGILAIDDDETVLRALVDDIGKNGYSVETATNVKEALDKLRRESFNIILTDIKMPDMDGLELLRTIKKTRPDVPVITMTSHGGTESVMASLKAGAYDYIKKPINSDELMIAIERGLEKHKLRVQTKRLLEKNKLLEGLVVRDGLTGLYNHKYLQEMLKIEFERARRYYDPLSCIMIDIDHFKVINDTYGHKFGDFVLASLSEIFQCMNRDVDIVARYGGEEFFFILPKTSLEGARTLAERIRETVHSHNFFYAEHSAIITISSGISSIADRDVHSKDDLVQHADKALYGAKSQGRNRVCCWDDVKLPPLEYNASEVAMVDDFSQKFLLIARDTKHSFLTAAKNFIKVVEAKDAYKVNHANKVSMYAVALAKELNVPDEEVEAIENAALLHDIGKVGVPQSILLKKKKLTETEYDLLKKHCTIGTNIITNAPFFEKEAPIILHHHERYDGTGYPNDLKGREIPYGARILTIADTYDAMTTDRAYREKYSKEDIVSEFKRLSGVQFDPEIVKPFLKLVKNEHFFNVP